MLHDPFDLRELFLVGMDRHVKEVLAFPDGMVLNLGAGKKLIVDTIPLDADRGWYAPRLPYADGQVAGIYAFHFLEHLGKDDLIEMLREIERVLKPGGSMISIVPLAGTEIAFHDFDHKTFWTEESWRQLFSCPYYDGTMPRDWKFKIQFNIIMGIVTRNLCIFSQIVRE